MANELLEATIHGNVEMLLKLYQKDPLILDRLMVASFEETPLHVAAMLGHHHLCNELLRLKPELARELDSRGSSPLHLASAKGHLEIVKTLVSIDPSTCFVRDKDGRNAVRVAAMKGRISVLKELLEAKPEAACGPVNEEGSILHLCVEFRQFEALKFLLQYVEFQESVKCKDGNGNTLLHLAVSDKQIHTIDHLINHTRVEVNTVNAYGLTAMDVLLQGRRGKNDLDIAEMLQRCGAKRAEDHNLLETRRKSLHKSFSSPPLSMSNTTQSPIHSWDLEKHDDWIERQRDALMVVASLIASMGFTAGVTPPAGVLAIQHDPTPGSSYSRFLIYNTISFISSLSIILLLVSGVPFKRRVFMWILMVMVWIAVASTAFTYLVSVGHHLQKDNYPVLRGLAFSGLLTLLIVMLIVIVFHSNRIYLMLVKNYRKPWRGMKGQIGIVAV